MQYLLLLENQVCSIGRGGGGGGGEMVDKVGESLQLLFSVSYRINLTGLVTVPFDFTDFAPFLSLAKS